MTGIVDIASWVPETCIDNLEQAAAFGLEPSFATDRIGAEVLPVIDDATQTSDMAAHAVRALLDKTGLDPQHVQALVLCTQNPDGRGLPHTSAIVQDKAGLPTSVAAFDMSLGCSGYVHGLHVLKGFMQSAGLTQGILVTADPYSRIIDRSDKNTALLFGDAATATLLGPDSRFDIGAAQFATDGHGHEAIINRDGVLGMAGRQVFNFAASKVPPQVDALLASAGLEKDQIDLFLLHQGSRYIVETLAKRMRLDKDKVPVALAKTGNTVSSSIPLILETCLTRQDIRTVLLSGFGVGLSWASTLLKRSQ